MGRVREPGDTGTRP